MKQILYRIYTKNSSFNLPKDKLIDFINTNDWMYVEIEKRISLYKRISMDEEWSGLHKTPSEHHWNIPIVVSSVKNYIYNTRIQQKHI